MTLYLGHKAPCMEYFYRAQVFPNSVPGMGCHLEKVFSFSYMTLRELHAQKANT